MSKDAGMYIFGGDEWQPENEINEMQPKNKNDESFSKTEEPINTCE